MTVNQLKTGVKGLGAAIIFSALLVSCDDDKSGNNSTTTMSEPGADTATTNMATTTESATPKKKSGRVSTTLAADDQSVKMEKDKMGYYNRTEVSPAYVGGQSAMEDFVNKNIEYPQDAIDNNIEGVVSVQFAVDDKGNISNVSTVGQKLGYGLEEEAIKVVSKMPKWTPGQVKGKNVKTWRTLPINYRLES